MSHKGLPYGAVKEIHRELVESGEKYVRYFAIGLLPATDKEPLKLVFGCLEEDKSIAPSGARPRKFFNPVKISVTKENIEKMLRIISVLAGSYMAMLKLLGGGTLEEAVILAEYDITKHGAELAREILERMKYLSKRG